MLIFHFFLKILSKSPCVRVSIFFVFFIFVQKVTFKIPIGTILNFFCKKSRFLHTLEIIDFSWDNHVIYRKKFTFFFVFQLIFPIVDKSKFHFFQSFLPYFRVTPPSPIVLLRKRQKVSKFYLLIFRQKLENRSLHAENDFFKIFEKMYLWGFWRKFLKICQVFRG